MNPKILGGKASYAATSSSSQKKNWVGHSSEGSCFGNIPKVDQLIPDVARLSIDTPQDNGLAVFSKKNKNQGETSSSKQCETVCDREIVWPPMVMVRYHVDKDDIEKVDKDDIEKDDNEKWIGRENRKLPDYNSVRPPRGLLHYFSRYNAVEARHSFGNRVISLLIFENSAMGYVEAEHLHKHFADHGADKDAWDHCKLLDGTPHQFYGYMANKEDVDIFNQHRQDEMKVKFEMRSHHEMDGDNPQLFWHYNKLVKLEKDAKARQDYYGEAAEKLRETLEENRILRQRTKMQHEQNKEEVHCERAEILDKELRETVCDREIVWPPMILVRYHEKVDKDDNKKRIGWGNRMLPDYNAVMARHSYGPRGLLHCFYEYNAVLARHSFSHRGMSLLIFENSVLGYLEAECLHKHFADQGADKDAWDHCKLLDGTPHQFYGYMANKEDVDIFNQHCQDEMKVKFEMRSHHEMVVIPMDGDNQHLFYDYSRAVKEVKDAKALQDFFGKSAEKLRETLEENRIVRQRTKMHHEQNNEEMDYQEQIFKDQINHIHQVSEEERAFEELLPEERRKMQQSIVDSSANEDLEISLSLEGMKNQIRLKPYSLSLSRQEEISEVIQTQAKNIKEFEAEREYLIQILEGEKTEIKPKYLEEEVEVEKRGFILHCIDRTDSPQPSTEQD